MSVPIPDSTAARPLPISCSPISAARCSGSPAAYRVLKHGPTMGRRNQGAGAGIVNEVHDRDIRKVDIERAPAGAAIRGPEDAEVRADVEPHGRVTGVDHDGIDRHVRQIATDIAPLSAAVRGLEHVTRQEARYDGIGRPGVRGVYRQRLDK